MKTLIIALSIACIFATIPAWAQDQIFLPEITDESIDSLFVVEHPGGRDLLLSYILKDYEPPAGYEPRLFRMWVERETPGRYNRFPTVHIVVIVNNNENVFTLVPERPTGTFVFFALDHFDFMIPEDGVKKINTRLQEGKELMIRASLNGGSFKIGLAKGELAMPLVLFKKPPVPALDWNWQNFGTVNEPQYNEVSFSATNWAEGLKPTVEVKLVRAGKDSSLAPAAVDSGKWNLPGTFRAGDAFEVSLVFEKEYPVSVGFLPKKDTTVTERSEVDTTFSFPPPIPEQFTLRQNYPNPFNAQTTIPFDLPEDSPVVLEVYNLRGQVVRTLKHEQSKAGPYAELWDGTNDAGQAVTSGIYIYRLEVSGRFEKSKKMILLK